MTDSNSNNGNKSKGEEYNIIRQNIPNLQGEENLGVLDSGYGNAGGSLNHDYNIPSCGIEDCDVALYKLFNETIKFSTQTHGGGQQAIYNKKPQVIFASGEKFALAKKLRPPRDKNEQLLLPSISIRRLSLEQTSEDITSRGMNQFTGDMTIKKRLDDSDPQYQNILNKMKFKNVADIPDTNNAGKKNSQENSYSRQAGMYLDPSLGQNIFEIITLPQPQFFTAKYEVVFWALYQVQMNYMIETFMSSFLPQGRMFRLGTDKGYWFMAYVEETYGSQDNFEDMREEKRIIKYSFNVSVKGFILAPNGPGNMVPVRKYISAPTLAFEIIDTPTTDILSERNLDTPPLKNDNANSFILSDINENPKTLQPKATAQKMLYKKTIVNPITGQKTLKYVRQNTVNQKRGEISYSVSDIQTLQEFILNEDK